MSNNKFWEIDESTEDLTPFYVWSDGVNCRILLEKAIEEYELIEIESQFGVSVYINFKIWVKTSNQFEYMKVKVDSKRLRNVLKSISLSCKKYPSVFDLKREGVGFKTFYSAIEVKAPHQSKIASKKIE